MVLSVEDEVVHNPQLTDSEDEFVIRKKHAYNKLIESDSDEDSTSVARTGKQDSPGGSCSDGSCDPFTTITTKKRRVVVRSESEPDDDVEVMINVTKPTDCLEESSGKFLKDSSCDPTPLPKTVNLTWYKDSTLYDAEGSDDEVYEATHKNVSHKEATVQEREPTTVEHRTKQRKQKLPGKSTIQPSKTDKTEVEKIYSESQRMLRETRLSLPYHKPRQRTLTEFLQRRRTLPAMPKSLKVSNEQMMEICKQLEEREKEVKEFFKSESEDSDIGETTGGNSVANQNDLNKVCSGKILNDGNEIFPDREDKINGIAIDNEKSEVNERVKEVHMGVNEENRDETVGGSDAVITSDHSLEDGVVSRNVNIQGAGKWPTDETKPQQDGTLKLFGSCIGNSNADPGDISVVNVQAISENIANTVDGIADHNTFKPSMSECSQVALDCTYDDAVTDSSTFKESMRAPVVETTACTELDSQGLVLCVSEVFNKDEESCEPVSLWKMREQSSSNRMVIESEETKNSENIDDGMKGANNDQESEKNSTVFSSASGLVVSNVDGHRLYDLNTTNNNFMHETAKQNLSMNVDSFTRGLPKNRSVVGLAHIDEVTVRPDENSQSGKQRNSPGSNVGVELSTSVAGVVSDIGEKMNSSFEIHHKLVANNGGRTDQKSLSIVGDISNFHPHLTGDSSDIVDLKVVPKPAGVRNLFERFLKHSSVKKKLQLKKQVVELGVVSAEKGPNGMEEVKKDVFCVTVGEDEETSENAELARPGAKFRRLKEELQQQIAKQREQEWNKRTQERETDKEVAAKDKGDCSPFEEELEDDMTESESDDEDEEEEEEEELDNVKIREKKRTKSVFVDDEAELSDEGNAADVSSDEDEDEDGGSCESDSIEKEEQATVEDTSHKNLEPDSFVDGSMQSKTRFHRLKTLDMFGSNGESSDDVGIEDTCPIPAYQPEGGMKCGGAVPISEEKSSQRHFLSPIFSLPMKSNRASSVKSAAATPGTPSSRRTASSSENTPHASEVRGQSRLHLTQKKLFAEVEPVGTQENVEELMDLCSGKFHDNPRNEMSKLVNPLANGSLTDQDSELLGLCSGKFESQSVQLASMDGKDEWRDTTDTYQLPGDSQDLHLTLSEDVLSPVNPDQYKEENSPQFTFNLASSDEENSLLNECLMKRKVIHSHKKLAFSDDENEDVGMQSSAGNSSESDGEEVCGVVSSHSELVAYDSEENEMVLPAKEGKVQSMAEFFENEAELSESEWGSADEDEQGLDNMDSEDGDEEQLDSKKVKEQLDKIHMRRMMDDDNREVRLLQELLFEDGELHSESGGRQRKFRWKNIDNLDENYKAPDPGDEDVYDVDDENEEQWRRMRHQREKFLLEQQAKGSTVAGDGVPENDDSQLMKLGRAALKRIHSCNSHDFVQEKKNEIRRTVSEPFVSPDPKRQFHLLVKRGSFLARGETALERLAQLTRGAADQNINGPKHSRKFVFATISPEKQDNGRKEVTQAKVQKRRSVEVTPPVIKKLRLSEEVAKGRCLLDHLVP